MKKLYAFILVTFLTFPLVTRAQVFVDTGYTALQMVTDFFGTSSCVTISNITSNPDISIGFFDGATSNLGLNAGMILTTGSIFDAQGPNDVTGATQMLNGGGDPTLDGVSMAPTTDVAIVEFDLVATEDTLCFKYVFGSEEFNDFVGTAFNDVFGFFVSGPGFGVDSNVALIPGTQTPVTINNVNCGANSAYYVCNDWGTPTSGGCTTQCPAVAAGTTVGYDGFTKPLCAKLVVVPGSTYHIKWGVGDASDQALDSGVFLSIESLCGGATLACVADFLPGFGTDPNEVSFDNESVYGSSWIWDFGDGNMSTEKNPTHEYSVDGTYNVMLVTCNFSGCDTTYEAITIGTTGINAPALSDLVVFPNPATNSLSVKSISGNTGIISIFDVAGRLMMQTEISGNALVDISSLTNGVYTVGLLSHQGVHRTRFNKQ